MNPQNLNDFGEWNQTESIQARRRLQPIESKALPQVFKLQETNIDMTAEEPIHDYQQRLERSKHNLKTVPNGETALRFLDHLGALGLSTARAKQAFYR